MPAWRLSKLDAPITGKVAANHPAHDDVHDLVATGAASRGSVTGTRDLP
jgi:hypothetical protein